MKLDMPLTALKGVGEFNQKLLANLEILTIRDLLYAFPRVYLDYSRQVKISQLDFEKKQTMVAQVKSMKNIFLRGKGQRTMQAAVLGDETGEINAVWFNMPFLETALVEGETYAFVAKLNKNTKTGKLQLNSPQFEKIKADMIHTSRIVPVYHLTSGLSPKKYRYFIKQVIDNLDLFSSELPEYTAEQLKIILPRLGEKKLFSHAQALLQIHFPDDFGSLKLAKFRLGVDELVPIQKKLLAMAEARAKAKSATKGVKVEKNIEKYWENFSFTPTADQLKTCEEIYKDFGTKASYRLIQGDVGSGKTAVAGYSIDLCLQAGKDCILMVPTTILANQHFQLLGKIFSNTILVTNETKTGKKPEPKINAPRLFIGTQALLHRYENLNPDLGMLIVDEEHRFGVKQREQLAKISGGEVSENTSNEPIPHYLSLTATPIPRTLALSIFGNIDISVIKSKPKQQLEKLTYLVPEYKREDSYQWIKNKIKEGNQIFWICPLIEQTKEVEDTTVIFMKDEKASVESIYKKIRPIFPEQKIAKLHGKLKEEEKQTILNKFRENKYQILVSTTVIEVGIDIPDANVIVIEGANNFGLAQLHQLRGRVGRGEKQGYCLLFDGASEAATINEQPDKTNERLKYFTKEADGLKLAKYDLATRGPGEVYGQIQSGIPNLKVADIRDDRQIEISRLIAQLY